MKPTINDEVVKQALDLISEKHTDLSEIFSEDGLLKQLTKGLVERALQAEIKQHLGFNKYEHKNSNNSRNGQTNKTLITENGTVKIDVPRDRDSSFDPILIPKRNTRIDGLNQKILSLYAKGMSVSDIKIQLEELYGANISTSLISNTTNEVMEEVKA
jgi:putative transposase